MSAVPNILSNRKNSNSTNSCNRAANAKTNNNSNNTLSVNVPPSNESRIRRMSHSWSFLKILNSNSNQAPSNNKLNHRPNRSNPAQHHLHHAHFPLNESVQVNFINSNHCASSGHLKSSMIGNHLHHNKFVWPNHHQHGTSDQCYQHHGGGSGCCGSTSGSTSGGGSGAPAHPIPSPGSYQQAKHKRAYVVDEVSRWIFPLSFIVLNIIYWAYYLDLMDSWPSFSVSGASSTAEAH